MHIVFIPFQIFVTRYLFWVSIFLVFFAAISRVSFFGFLYLLVCFALLYRGQNMLMDQKNKRIKRYQKCVIDYSVCCITDKGINMVYCQLLGRFNQLT